MEYCEQLRTGTRGTVVWQLTGRGFCSELNMMLLAAVYALEQDCRFVLCSKYSNIAREHGWRDYFEPFCNESAAFPLSRSLIFLKRGLSYRWLLELQRRLLQPALGSRLRLTPEVWDQIYTEEFCRRTIALPGSGKAMPVSELCRRIAAEIWRFTPEINEHIEATAARLLPAKRSYGTLHIRRGDKITEAEHTAVDAYLAKLDEVGDSANLIFVMTDDYRVVEELRRRRPAGEYVSLCSPHDSGHDQRLFNERTPEERYAATLQLVTELEIAARGEYFIGTFSSNVGRFMALLGDRQQTFGIDMPFCMHVQLRS